MTSPWTFSPELQEKLKTERQKIRKRLIIIGLHPRAREMVGLIPTFLDVDDARPARDQFNEKYVGGWNPFEGFKLDGVNIVYPGDPPYEPVAYIPFRNEEIIIYRFAWVMIIQPNGDFEISRMD